MIAITLDTFRRKLDVKAVSTKQVWLI